MFYQGSLPGVGVHIAETPEESRDLMQMLGEDEGHGLLTTLPSENEIETHLRTYENQKGSVIVAIMTHIPEVISPECFGWMVVLYQGASERKDEIMAYADNIIKTAHNNMGFEVKLVNTWRANRSDSQPQPTR